MCELWQLKVGTAPCAKKSSDNKGGSSEEYNCNIVLRIKYDTYAETPPTY